MSELNKYRVMLHELPGDKFTTIFYCQADDPDHADDQARNAYPGCEIVDTIVEQMVDFNFLLTVRAEWDFDITHFKEALFDAISRMFDEGLITPVDSETLVDSSVRIEVLP